MESTVVTTDDPPVEEHESSAITQSILDDDESESDTDQREDTAITLGRGIFIVGACGAGGWLVGYSAVVYWTVDPWLVGPALALFLGGVVGLVIGTFTTSSSSDAENDETAEDAEITGDAEDTEAVENAEDTNDE